MFEQWKHFFKCNLEVKRSQILHAFRWKKEPHWNRPQLQISLFFCKVLCHSGHVHNQSYSGGFPKSKIHLNDFPFYFYSNQAKRPQPTIRHDFLTCITNHKLIVRFLLCFVCVCFYFKVISLLFFFFSLSRQTSLHTLSFFLTGGKTVSF